MGIRVGIEAKLEPFPPGLQIAAAKTEPVLALAPPASRVRHLREPAGPDDLSDVDDLTPPLQGGLREQPIFSDPD